ncbi:hypothetical protein BDR04DRAFT_1138187 [Suillus decipiens]|nr:hypothetical protein BDR04DRAFT_1138187 [Suillus decipiens]
MSSQGGAYDQNLLDEAPVATKAQRQEGYNVDLLDDRPVRPTSTQPLQSPRTIPSDVDLESSSLTREKIVPGVSATHASRPTQSFWRTRNGKITIFVVAIIIIGAVVGGAVADEFYILEQFYERFHSLRRFHNLGQFYTQCYSSGQCYKCDKSNPSVG